MVKKRTENNSLILSEIGGQLAEEQTYQSKLRQAVFDAVSESDVKDIVEGIVEKAKAGDEKATKMVFDYVLGSSQPVSLTQNNYHEHHHSNDGDGPPSTPPLKPGESPSVDRLDALQRRAVNGLPLHSN